MFKSATRMIPGSGRLLAGIREPVDTLAMMSRIKQPVLVLHGTDDQVVPASQVNRQTVA